ncbi:hypothetical protein C9374_008600 [Naegleria lovaniensis]|uniref:Rho family small GTPase n=1 Tax=Naegleria lovaniensis TaxID=51637 RepID=A0AA88GKU0_NAELO|nr:uncharacterized protein C9374_008600 [Naegleria lovaniensis]KAG2377978.1 hypothetical protein C9374_008600 [Naegleria lovaniensis]
MDTSVKVVVVGDGAVGKTCMLYCYANNQFPEDYVPTVFDNYNANMLFGNQSVSLGLWDTAGQEDYDSLRPLSYAETDVFLACFSVVSKTSLNNVKQKWLPEIKQHMQKKTPILLVGLKKDLRLDPKTTREVLEAGDTIVSEKEGKDVAEALDCVTYCECSAKTRDGLEEVFMSTVAAVLNPQQISHKDVQSKKNVKKCCLVQ